MTLTLMLYNLQVILLPYSSIVLNYEIDQETAFFLTKLSLFLAISAGFFATRRSDWVRDKIKEGEKKVQDLKNKFESSTDPVEKSQLLTEIHKTENELKLYDILLDFTVIGGNALLWGGIFLTCFIAYLTAPPPSS